MSPDFLPPAAPVTAPGLAPIIDVSAGEIRDDCIFGSGWGPCEGDLRWAVGHHSDIIIRPGFWHHASCYGRIFALIDATPFLGLDFANPQHIGISLNGHFLREVSLLRSGFIAFWIPSGFIGRPLMIGLSHLGARIPAAYGMSDDTRSLAFAFHRLQIWNIPDPAGVPPAGARPASSSAAEILGRFESLGDNCEFGLAQRSTGLEPLGLFRFTATPLASLINGLLHEFAGLGEKEHIRIEVRGEVREYILNEERWNLTYHTFVLADDMPADRVIHREAQKLTLLKRRMLDDLRAARRIYLVKHNDGLAEEDVLALFLLLNRFAPNRLLYVGPQNNASPAGSVRQLTPGLICGHIERFAPYAAAVDFSINAWLAVCAQALEIFDAGSYQTPAQRSVALA